MYVMGLRIGEAQDFDPRWIDASRRLTRVIGKGDKERIVPLPAPFIEYLRSVWRLHRNPNRLFANSPDRPLTLKTLYDAFKQARKSVGLPDTIPPHVFRHSYATRMLERKLDTPVVQILLGHASPKTTRRYLHLTEPIRDSVQDIVADIAGDLINPWR